jgi:hypothetical protein
MADLPISGLPPVTVPGANDEFGINQGLTSFKVNRQQMLALPNFDVSMSMTPFSIGTIGMVINATAAVTLTTFDSVESNQTAIEDGTMWAIEAEGGDVTVAEGAGVTLQYFDGSSVVTGSKVVPTGATAMLRKVNDTTYRIMTNEGSGGGGGGGSTGLETIQIISETLSAGGTFTSDNFDASPGDIIIFDITFTKPSGDSVDLDFNMGTGFTLVNVNLTDQVNLSTQGRIRAMLGINDEGDWVFQVDGQFIDGSTLTRDHSGDTGSIGATQNTNFQIDENIFNDDYELTGYIARVQIAGG